METIVARLSETRQAGRVTRRADFAGRSIWWEIEGPDETLPAPLALHDVAATALVNFAMSQGAALRVDGPVSRSLLENLEDFVASWALWRPDLYRRVDVSAAEEVAQDHAPEAARPLAVAAFSGGVDGSFTLLRHVRGDAGRRSRRVAAAVMIHGMDIPLDKPEAFEVARRAAAASLASLGVALATVRTNWKREFPVNWEMEFGAGISSVLRHWQETAATGLLGSGEDYSRLVIPWGGNPISIAMLGSNRFRLTYDGGEYTRTEKVGYLTGWKEGVEGLRICWAGPMTGRNCGVCEKCLRTKLNFLAVGAELPPSLPGRPTARQVLGIGARNAVQVALLQEIADVASRRGVNDPWTRWLRLAIAKNRLLNRARASALLRPVRARLKAPAAS